MKILTICLDFMLQLVHNVCFSYNFKENWRLLKVCRWVDKNLMECLFLRHGILLVLDMELLKRIEDNWVMCLFLLMKESNMEAHFVEKDLEVVTHLNFSTFRLYTAIH
jgi:hypothetical protein